MSVALRIRAMARAIRADAEERASVLDALADEIERGSDALVSVEDGAAMLGMTPRALRDDLRRRGVVVEKAGGKAFVRRSNLTAKIVPPRPVAKAANDDARTDDRADDRAAFERAVARQRRKQ